MGGMPLASAWEWLKCDLVTTQLNPSLVGTGHHPQEKRIVSNTGINMWVSRWFSQDEKDTLKKTLRDMDLSQTLTG